MFVAGWAGSCAASMAAWLGCSAASCCTQNVMRQSARVAYCFLFTLSMIVAWLMRDFGKPLLERIPWVVRRVAGEPSDAFFGLQAVYRISLGNCLFFGALALALLGVERKADPRAKLLMAGSPAVKLGLWLVANALPFLLPSSAVLAYGYVARLGSVAFLVIQLFLLVDFVLSLNERWVAAGEADERHYQAMAAVSGACYVASFVILGLLLHWFKPAGAGACSFNVAVITLSLVLFATFTIVSVSPFIRSASLFPSALISLYVSYLAYGALQSEPHSEACNGLGHKIDAASGGTLAVGMLLVLLSVVYSAYKAGSNSSTFSLRGDNDADDAGEAMLSASNEATSAGLDGAPAPDAMARPHGTDGGSPRGLDEFTEPVPYNYAFFHLVFALASTYLAMLLTGWGSGSEERALMDIGWASVGMKLATQWATGLLYLWALVAPTLLEDRSFG